MCAGHRRRAYHLCLIAASSLVGQQRRAAAVVHAVQPENLVVGAGERRVAGVLVRFVALPNRDASLLLVRKPRELVRVVVPHKACIGFRSGRDRRIVWGQGIGRRVVDGVASSAADGG